jgi:hypothetical protein
MARTSFERCGRKKPDVYLKITADLLPKQATLDVDVSVTRALDAVSAFRLLQPLPRHELEQLRNDVLNTGD